MSLIQRTNKGSSKSKTSGTTLSVASVAIAENGSVVVCLAHDPATVSGITWNSIALTKIVEETNTGNVQGSIWALHNCAAATASVDVTFGSAIDAKAMTVVQLIGDTGTGTGGQLNHDQSASDQGTGTAPSSGATAALTYGSEYAVAMGGWETTIGGGGSGAFTFSGQVELTTGGADDTNISIAEYYFQQDAGTGAVTFANTGATSADWVALVVTFYQIADHIRVDQEFRTWYYAQDRVQVAQQMRTWYYAQDRVQVAQQMRTWYYAQDRVQVAQQYRTWWYTETPGGLEIFAAIM